MTIIIYWLAASGFILLVCGVIALTRRDDPYNLHPGTYFALSGSAFAVALAFAHYALRHGVS